jgi:hypothetical protein
MAWLCKERKSRAGESCQETSAFNMLERQQKDDDKTTVGTNLFIQPGSSGLAVSSVSLVHLLSRSWYSRERAGESLVWSLEVGSEHG